MIHSHEYGTCPVCNGSGRVPAGNDRYKTVMAGYDKETDTHVCRNCGGQYQSISPKGKVLLNKNGQPCVHFYSSRTIGRCYTQYICDHCGDRYEIDSSD